MSGPVDCGACGEKVSAVAVRCPHCGERLRDVDIGDAKVTADEAAALLAFHDSGGERVDADHQSPYGVIGSLFMPHPATRGAHRTTELALTAVGLPAIVGGVAAFAVLPKTYRQASGAAGAGGLAIAATAGGLAFYAVMVVAGVGGTLAAGLAATSAGALLLRRAVQHLAVRAQDPDLVGKLEKPEPLALPAAIARERTSPTPEPDGALIAVPDQPDAPAPGDEPSLLK